ncbi:hypothetical protein [Bradyrhizobium sp. USDA 10063]
MVGTPISTRLMEGQYRWGMLVPALRVALICIKDIRSVLPPIGHAHTFQGFAPQLANVGMVPFDGRTWHRE